MNPAHQARWSVVVPRDLDRDLRVFLAETGQKKGDLSRFVEEAVRARLFEQTVEEARSGFADMAPDEAQALIDEAVAAARKRPVTPKAEPR